jgi:hypothetical protein
MKYYCVVTSFYDDGRVRAYMNEESGQKLPKNHNKELKKMDVYYDYFKDERAAREFCEEAKNA